MSLGIALALEQDFATSPRLEAFLANGDSGAYQRGATHVLRTTIENRHGRIGMRLTVTSLSTQRNTRADAVDGPSSAGVLAAVNALAKRVDPQSSAFSTSNEHAWQTYTVAAAAQNAQERARLLSAAIQADPAFGLAYLVLAQTLTRAGDNNLTPLMAAAAAHRNSFTPLDQARFAALVSRTLRAPLAEQAKATAAVLQVAPNDVDALATLGSERFLQGDAKDGEGLLNRALELNPGNATIRVQLAEGLLESRRFAEAEKIFTGIDNNPAVLPELAVCILLEGDVARANTVFTAYLRERAAASDTLLFLAQANWLAISKQPSEGVLFLARNHFPQDDLRSLALSQSAIWQLMDKDPPSARKNAALAEQLAKAPVPKLFGQIAALVSNGDQEMAAWRDEVNRAPLELSVKRAVIAYGLFLNGHYAEAVQSWQDLEKESGGADLRARAMLAASLERLGSGRSDTRTGRSDDARKVDVEPFIPNLTGADQFSVLTFNEMRRLLNLKMH